MTGTPAEMQVGHIGGPDSEVFYDFGEDLKIHENSIYKSDKCHPNCDCGRFLEIGNSVFIQYKKVSDTKLEELPQKNVDFGGGLERITAAVNDDPDVFKTDLFFGLIKEIEKKYKVQYGNFPDTDKSIRIIAEHSRAASALVNTGIVPGNKLHSYVLRRLIRRLLIHLRYLSPENVSVPFVDLKEFGIQIPFKDPEEVKTILEEETEKFKRVMDKGIQRLKSIVTSKQKVSGEVAFDLYQSYGFPLELTLEHLQKVGIKFSDKNKKEFEKEFESHQEKSRTTSAGVFKGGLADHSPEVVKLHTATHLLLATLRKELGENIVQKGQNITKDRSRFDFPGAEKLTNDQLTKIENKINDLVKENLTVSFEVMPKEVAEKTGAIHAFNEKYANTVKVYYVGKDLKSSYSKEFCGGPHVAKTSEIGRVRIKKQEKIGSGLIRIYLTLED
jgi:alanyl-tRNA synthetase